MCVFQQERERGEKKKPQLAAIFLMIWKEYLKKNWNKSDFRTFIMASLKNSDINKH